MFWVTARARQYRREEHRSRRLGEASDRFQDALWGRKTDGSDTDPICLAYSGRVARGHRRAGSSTRSFQFMFPRKAVPKEEDGFGAGSPAPTASRSRSGVTVEQAP